MKFIHKIRKDSLIYLLLVGVIVRLIVEILFRWIGMIPSINKQIYEIINQTVGLHLPDTNTWSILLNILVWTISVIPVVFALLLANTLFGKFLKLIKNDSYDGYTGQFCFKSGTYRARVNPDYEVDVLAGRMFPLAVTKKHQIVPTAWEFVKAIENNESG